MFKKEKIKEILTAKELLKIESVNRKIPGFVRNILIAVVSIGYIFALQIHYEDAILWIWIIGISLFYGIILAIIIRITSSKGNPLIITERGIVINPYLAEFWEDIEKYGWETFKGLTRVSFSSKRQGVSLYLINSGTFQRNVETWTGHTMLAQYGIFFTDEQIEGTEKVFQKYGINKIKKS